MTPFTTLTGIAAPLPVTNIDTDKILAGRYLKTITRAGLGRHLFSTLRENPDFILNRMPWSSARILIALDNFGCGSSREHAPWALLDFGIRCVIAPSIADIFYNNCFKNGILPIALPRAQIDILMDLAKNPESAGMTVDLPSQTITTVAGPIGFSVEVTRKQNLLAGMDDIANTLEFSREIEKFETLRDRVTPWVPHIAPARLRSK
ncbi:MAG TPA: 3-isopropylmalate dehydratase small subunit [Sphingobium sp.]